jgi:hypothetical protein
VANLRGHIPLTVSIDDQLCEAHSTYSWAAGGGVLTLSTVLPERGLAAELISTYVGHTDTPTIATHLMLGPLGQPATILTAEHPTSTSIPSRAPANARTTMPTS